MIKTNSVLSSVNRLRSKYGSVDSLRLHASERDLAFDKRLWDYFISSLTQEDVQLYPNIDRAYDLVSQLTETNKEFLTVAEGSDRILKNIFHCFAVKGLKVLSTIPCFPMYDVYAKLYDATFVGIEYKTEKFPFDEFLESIDDQTSLVIIYNTSSPVGDILSIEQLTAIANRCKDNDCLLAVDEAYIEFSNAVTASSLITEYNIVAVRTLSKAYGSAGVRIGYSISNAFIKQCLDKVSSMNEISSLSIKWLEALCSYDDSDVYINLVKEHRESLSRALIKCNVNYIDSQTNYINICGNLKLEGVLTKTSMMPWNGLEYTRVSIPADEVNFRKLISEVSKL
jgi:histidinol-phosphate aminotransferase